MIKVGIVGTNFISDRFIQATYHVENIEVVGVCSGKKENAIVFKEKYKLPLIFDSYEDMLESGSIDAVYIATPNIMHYPMTLKALEKRIPVFCEKPFGLNDIEVKNIFEASKKYQTYVHNGIVPLYTKNFKILKDNLHKVGRIRRVTLNFCKYSSRYDAYLENKNPTTFRKDLGNGSIMDLGIYLISDAIALFGKPNKVTSSGVFLESGVDALGTIILSYDGFEVTLIHSKISDSEIVSEISGEKGYLQIEVPSLINKIYLKERGKEKVAISLDEDGFIDQIKDFVYNIENRRLESRFVSQKLSLEIHEVLVEARKNINLIYEKETKDF